MAQSLFEKISSVKDSQHGPLMCAIVLVTPFALSEVLSTALGNLLLACQTELMTLLLLAAAYHVGFSNANARPLGAPKAKMAGSKNVLPPKITTPVCDPQARQPVRPAGRLASQIPRGATGAPRIPRDAANFTGENHEATKKLSPMTTSEQREADTQLLSQAKNEGISPDGSTYAKVMDACNRLNNVDVALDLYKQMLEKGVPYDNDHLPMNNHTVSKFFRLVAENLDEKRMRETGLQLLEIIQAHGVVPTNAIQNCLICAWKSKLPDHVLEVFVKLRERGVSLSSTAYRCIMAAHERTDPERTLKLYDEMVERGVKLDRVAYNAALCACSHLGMVDQALELFEKMPEHALVPNGKTYGALIKACTSTGKMKEAVDLFGSMREAGIEPNQFAYHDAIQSCVRMRKIGKAITLYRDMIQANVSPCDKTYVYLGKECQKRGWAKVADQILQAGADSKAAQARGEHAPVPAPPAGLEELLRQENLDVDAGSE
jgi:pentatricopeptide repeat domain-containing protein 1